MTMAESPAGSRIRDLICRNRKGEQLGVYSICSAHPSVIDAGLHQAIADGSLLLIESTSSQVNQFGGYTGQTPKQFAAGVRAAAQAAGVPKGMLMLGGDHLGPYPWRDQPAGIALQKACDLVRACVLAGYEKIHLDASMSCGDDGPVLGDETIAQRAARLCRVAEDARSDLPTGSPPPLYVIGTEVPTPGGETSSGHAPAVTTVDQLHHTLEVCRAAFEQQSLSEAWERVLGIVVQPGVEFGEKTIFAYDRRKAHALSVALPHEHPCLVYEAHSTDYQTPAALAQMVQDHFAILKVGPALTFAYREAIFALSEIEQDCCSGKRRLQLSNVREALDAAMLRNPSHWRSYYHGGENEQRVARAFSYSDRCRYYWTDSAVQKEIIKLCNGLSAARIPLTLISQYLPPEYAAIRAGRLQTEPEALIRHHICCVLGDYAAACGAKPSNGFVLDNATNRK
jgi:D-tagatose-1,6-bisphosphate aldolase subunit GatZ/KbaZ